MVGAALRSRDREAAAMKASLEPEEAELASADAELKIIAGLGRTAQREAAATAQIAETRAVIAEQKTLIERLTGCAIVTSDPGRWIPGAQTDHRRGTPRRRPPWPR